MSDRNLAEVISFSTKIDYALAYNDVLGAGTSEVEGNTLQLVTAKLVTAGLQAWIDEG